MAPGGGVRLVRIGGLLLLCTLFIFQATRRLWWVGAVPAEAHGGGSDPTGNSSIKQRQDAAAAGGAGAKANQAPAVAAVTVGPRRAPVVVVDYQLPRYHVYSSKHPYPVAAHCFGAGLEHRNWTTLQHPHPHPERPAHLVVRLPNADFASELRPLPRFLVGLCLLLAAEEAGVAATRFSQLHFVAPSGPPALMRGSSLSAGGGGVFDGRMAPNPTTTTTSTAASVVAVVGGGGLAAAASGSAAAAERASAVDADGVRHWRWSVHLQEQPPADRFTRPWAGPIDEAGETKAGAGGITAGAGGVLERSLKRRPLLVGPAAASLVGGQALVTRVADPDLHDLGGFGRYPSNWTDAFGLQTPGRAARLRALALGLCNVTVTAPTAAEGGVKVVLYNRDATRRLRRAHVVREALLARLPLGSEVVLVVHREDRPICDLVALLADADALVTPHGFSAMLALFLPPEALLVEINPYRFGGFAAYARLAAAFGVEHWAVASEPVRKLQPALLDVIAPIFLPGHDPRRCKDSTVCRFLARQFPVRLDEEDQLAALAARIQDAGAQRRRLALGRGQ